MPKAATTPKMRSVSLRDENDCLRQELSDAQTVSRNQETGRTRSNDALATLRFQLAEITGGAIADLEAKLAETRTDLARAKREAKKANVSEERAEARADALDQDNAHTHDVMDEAVAATERAEDALKRLQDEANAMDETLQTVEHNLEMARAHAGRVYEAAISPTTARNPDVM